MNIKKILVLTFGVFLIASVKVQANLDQMKVYKTAYPDAKPKCINCHTDAIPKKDEGKHNWNAYGKKVKEAATPKPTAETYKKVGKIEDFKEEKAK